MITLDETIVLGVDDIDNQHALIVRLFNTLSEAVQAGQDVELLGKTAHYFFSHVQEHFATEEYYMTQYEYPLIEEQRREHCELEGYVEELTRLLRAEGDSAALCNILEMVGQWLLRHVRHTDRDLMDFIKRRRAVRHTPDGTSSLHSQSANPA